MSNNITEFKINVDQLITGNTTIDVECVSLYIQNTGDTTVRINRNLTLFPGQWRSYSVEDHNIISQRLSFVFQAPIGTMRVEIEELRSTAPGMANYKPR